MGGNVHLIERLWPEAETPTEGDIVYVWPKNRQRKVPPLMLRLIKVGSGRKAVYLLANVLDRQRLSKRAAGHRPTWTGPWLRTSKTPTVVANPRSPGTAPRLRPRPPRDR